MNAKSEVEDEPLYDWAAVRAAEDALYVLLARVAAQPWNTVARGSLRRHLAGEMEDAERTARRHLCPSPDPAAGGGDGVALDDSSAGWLPPSGRPS